MIQESKHNPVIDAQASIQLVLLKLRKGMDFGDVIMNGCTNIFEDDEVNIMDSNLNLSDPASISKFIYQTGLNINQDFFDVLRDNKITSNFNLI